MEATLNRVSIAYTNRERKNVYHISIQMHKV